MLRSILFQNRWDVPNFEARTSIRINRSGQLCGSKCLVNWLIYLCNGDDRYNPSCTYFLGWTQASRHASMVLGSILSGKHPTLVLVCVKFLWHGPHAAQLTHIQFVDSIQSNEETETNVPTLSSMISIASNSLKLANIKRVICKDVCIKKFWHVIPHVIEIVH